MVVLSAGVLNAGGKTLLARQYVDMTRIRAEGLLSAFTKLMGTGRQYTYFDTDSVRYLYQPMESQYLVLITNKGSNIVEDLETLRLLGQLISEHCLSLEEAEIVDKSFDIMISFDEVIQMGYREHLNVEQVKQILKMESQEEVLANAVRESKEQDAVKQAQIRAQQLKQQSRTGISGAGNISSEQYEESSLPSTPIHSAPAAAAAAPAASRPEKSGMKLGSKGSKNQNAAMKKIAGIQMDEGPTASSLEVAQPAHTQNLQVENVHIKVDEKITASLSREGTANSVEVKGDMFLTINDPALTTIKIQLNKEHNGAFTWKPHPNINKSSFTADRLLALKDVNKPFPVGNALPVLRWRLSSSQGFEVPLSITAWPGEGNCTVEYEMPREDVVLNNVRIMIPLGGASATVTACDEGEAEEAANGCLVWSIDRIDSDNGSASMEFDLSEASVDLFPIELDFFGERTLANVELSDVSSSETGKSVKFSSEVVLSAERYLVE